VKRGHGPPDPLQAAKPVPPPRPSAAAGTIGTVTGVALPSAEEAAALVPGPRSLLWRLAGDARLMSTAGYALVLQVAHPTVAAGVREHSSYAEDPWGRLLRTLDYVYLMTYGGPETAAVTGRRLREMHRRIKGVAPDGRRYYALEPEAFAWVHATLIDAIVLGHRRFGQRLGQAEIDRLYDEWLRLGRLVGVREVDLPAEWTAFRAYFDRMVDERLEDSDVVHGVLSVLSRPAPPPVPHMWSTAWRLLWLPLGRAVALATVGLLPARLRERLGLGWTPAHELELRALALATRTATPVMPRSMCAVGPDYLRWRRPAIARGELGDGGW
jgi:uncharacterized protein (DUF2236 family)